MEENDEFTPRHAEESQGYMLSSQAYDMLKLVAQIILPGIGALYFALSQIWGLPAGEQVIGTITAVDVFLGLLLASSTRAYNKDREGPLMGFIDVVDDGDDRQMVLNFPGDPNDIVDENKVTFKVRKRS